MISTIFFFVMELRGGGLGTGCCRKVEELLEPEARGVEGEEVVELMLEADGEDEDTEPDCGMQDASASTPLKKQRSGRKDGGANQWTNQADEIRRIVRKKRRNRAFPPQTLVWAKLEDRPWWPARVGPCCEVFKVVT